jgi:putative heme-binding domain-containing protein
MIGSMTRRARIFCLLSVYLLISSFSSWAEPLTDADRKQIAIEALVRLKGTDLSTNAAFKTAVLKVLNWTRGTPDFVTIVRDFHIPAQSSGLLEVVENNPADGSGVEALRLIFSSGGSGLVQEALLGTNLLTATRIVEALGNTHDKQIVPLLLPLVTDTRRDVALRKQSVRSLAQVPEGAAQLLKLVREEKLPADVRFTAGMELNAVRWPELKAEAAQLLPPPQGRNTIPLPPVPELLKMSGDARRGAQVFTRPEVGCINCHRVNDRGVDLGPALSEIGAKLGKDGLYEAILDPSAGIAFGYEAWQIDLKSGDEAYGLIVSEAADELVLKDAKAIATHIKKSDIAQRRQMKLSLMPAGLQQTMSTQDLVDLVEYLSLLRKAK